MRNTWEGKGTENSWAKSTSPRSMKPSMRWFTSADTSSSRSAILRGENIGSSSLRNFLCSGGSICSGIIGRLFFRSTASMLEEKISGWRSAWSISSLRDSSTPWPAVRSMGMTGTSRISLKMGCGFAAISGSIADSGFAPSADVSVSVWVSMSVNLHGVRRMRSAGCG